MKIGCVKEIKNNEFRVGLTPASVKAYCEAGHTVYMEADAGAGSGFATEEYAAAGAVILNSAKEVWDSCEMMIKVEEPLEEEYAYFHEGLILYTYLHLAADRALTDSRALKSSGRGQISGKALWWFRNPAGRRTRHSESPCSHYWSRNCRRQRL